MWELIDLLAELPVQPTLKPSSDGLLGCFGLAVALGVSNGGVVDRDVVLPIESLDGSSHALRSII